LLTIVVPAFDSVKLKGQFTQFCYSTQKRVEPKKIAEKLSQMPSKANF
jgi:hypothetical protein